LLFHGFTSLNVQQWFDMTLNDMACPPLSKAAPTGVIVLFITGTPETPSTPQAQNNVSVNVSVMYLLSAPNQGKTGVKLGKTKKPAGRPL
jgi:hypothetical protein